MKTAAHPIDLARAKLDAAIAAKAERSPRKAGELPDAGAVVTAVEFLKNFRPVETVVEGLPIPRGGVTGLTAITGHGKTTVAAALEAALITGRPFAGRRVSQGSVLVLAGENPADYAMHLIATKQECGLADADLDRLLVRPGAFILAKGMTALRRELQGHELVAVIVDTSVAFNHRGDENGNLEQHDHAIDLRRLTTLPGNPAVIVLCHPKLNPTRETLLPRGGGAFLNEIDANLTLWQDASGLHTLHWAGKIRGPNFDPIIFEMVLVELAGYLDSRGNPLVSTAARHVSEERAEVLHAKAVADEDVLLKTMWRYPNASVAELAKKAGWTSGTGRPQKSRVARLLEKFVGQKLVEQDRKGTYRLSAKGLKEAEVLR